MFRNSDRRFDRLRRVVAGSWIVSVLCAAPALGAIVEGPGTPPPPPDVSSPLFVGIGGNPPVQFEGVVWDNEGLMGDVDIFVIPDDEESTEFSVPLLVDVSGNPWTKTISIDISDFGIQTGAVVILWEEVVIRPPESPSDLLAIQGWRQFIPEMQDWHFYTGNVDDLDSGSFLFGWHESSENGFSATSVEFWDPRVVGDFDLHMGSVTFEFDPQPVTQDGVYLLINSFLVYTGETLGPSGTPLTLTMEQMVAIPEPRAYALIVGLLALYTAGRRRWRRG